MKCNEATEETETRSSEKFLQLSCFIEKGYIQFYYFETKNLTALPKC